MFTFGCSFTCYPIHTADLVIFIEETLNGKLHFLCSVMKEIENWDF